MTGSLSPSDAIRESDQSIRISASPPATPDYDDVVTSEQHEVLRRFMDQFDLTGFVEEE